MADNIGLDTGDLRHQVIVQANTSSQDRFNQPQPVWTTWLTRWAKIESTAGGTYIQSAQVRNLSTHVVTMRYLAGLAPSVHRIVYQGRMFNIISVVVPDERKIASVCYCQEVL